ncbi:MAG: hypothetical protein BZ136_06965 [Methanosphaera sp. rholeuAM74]|nr:MAG: hypothetical protein BZ136_06965 [Methanosphaera sp. rholeuAM74]
MINVVFSSDDNYAIQLMVSLNSLMYNNSDENIDVYILSNNISSENKDNIIKIVEKYDKKSVKFVEVNTILDYLNGYVDNSMSDITVSTYSRLFLATLLPHLDKVLYLDCDSIITESVSQLWHEDIDNYMCAGVLDLMPEVYKKAIGLDEDDDYINAGVMLINLKKWKDENIEEKFMTFLLNLPIL